MGEKSIIRIDNDDYERTQMMIMIMNGHTDNNDFEQTRMMIMIFNGHG